jgi:hypothetical protein
MTAQPGQVELTHILALEDAWPRVELDEDRVDLFAEIYETEGLSALPPLEVLPGGQGSGFVLADGWHRLSALRRLEQTRASVMILPLPPGEDPVAVAYHRALEVTVKSTKPLTSAEKRAAIARLIDEDPSQSDRAIARLVGADHKTVASVRARGISPPQRRPPTAAEHAERLLRGFEMAYDARGLGVADFFLGDRTGERFAEIFRDAYGEDALPWAQAMETWLGAAIGVLERDGPKDPE